jgi:hypothetical protein
MKRTRLLSIAAALVLLPAGLSLPQAQATINALTLVLSQSTATSTYGSAAPSTTVDVKFLSSGAAEDSVKISAVLASAPAGQTIQPTLSPISSSGGNVQSDGATSNITPLGQGVVSSQFTVSMSSGSQLSAGTYSLLILASTPNPSDSLRQNVTFIINPAPTPVISVELSRIWMAQGSTPASESNNSNTLSANAMADLTNPVANITVDLRDTANIPMTNLPITAFVQGPGVIGIGSTPPSRSVIGRALIGQPNQYSISLFGDGLFGTSTISIVQNGVSIGVKTFTFTQSASLPPSVLISNVTVDKTNVSAGGTVIVEFTSATTSLPAGQIAYAALSYAEDCLDGSCNVSGPATLQSGDSSNGKWSASLSVPSTALSGKYAVTIYFPQLNGVSGAVYRHSQTISVAGVEPKPVPPPTAISMSNLSLSQTKLSTGDTLVLRLNVKTSSLTAGVPLQATIFTPNDCEDDSCSSYGTGKLVTGTLEQGVWEIAVPIHSNLLTGTYSINYGFFKLKGTSGAIGTLSDAITISGVTPKPVPPPASASMSILSSNNKTSFSIGDTFIVKIAVTTSNFPLGVPIQATIFTPDCEDEYCSAWAVGKLASGNLENGVWEIAIPIHNQMLSGKYSMNFGFFKLKGTTGAIGTSSDFLEIQGVTPPPVPLPAVINISNIKPSSTSIDAGSALTIQFDLASTNVDVKEVVQVYLTDDSSGNCDEGCGLGTAKLVQGSIANGAWIAQFSIPNTVPTGNYSLVVAIPKRKGVTGAFTVYSQLIYVTGAPKFTPVYLFSSIKISTNSVRVGQNVTGYFVLKTNDDKVSTPACIIDGIAGWTNAMLVSGGPMAGSWECKLTIPSDAISGNYKLTVAVVGYANGNKNEERADLGSLVVSGTTLVQTATSQQCQNYLSNFSSGWSSINSRYNEMKLSLGDPKYSQMFFIGKFRNWSELYSEKLNSLNSILLEAERMFTLSSSNEVKSCDFYDFSSGLGSKYSSVFSQQVSSAKALSSDLAVWYQKMQSSIPDPVKYFNPQIETGALDIQKVSEPTLGKVIIDFAYQSSVGVAKVACTSNFGICDVLQNGANSSGNSYYGVAEITKIAPGTFLNFTLSQLGSTGNQIASFQQTYTSLRAGLQPSLGTIASIQGGCSFKILNYDPLFTWFAKSEMKIARDGTATISSNGSLATDEYLSTSRTGYQTVNAINTLFKCVPLNSDTIGTNPSTAPVETIDDDGSEELPTGTLKVKKEASGKYLISISSNLSEEKLTLTASRKGKTTIRFSATTNEDGAVRIRTTRNLSGYTLKLIFDGQSLKTIKIA